MQCIITDEMGTYAYFDNLIYALPHMDKIEFLRNNEIQ